MDNPHSPSPLRETDYEAIESAVMETEKGRWFLAEFARRNRVTDTDAVLDAIASLRRMLHRERRPDVERIRLDIGEMKDAIERTKREISEIKDDAGKGSRFDRASNELDAIVTQTEAATSDILSSAEKLQEISWMMREEGIDPNLCNEIETEIMTIYTSCSFQDLTGQRTQKVVHVLRYLETRIDAMIDIWGMESSDAEEEEGKRRRGPLFDTRPDAHLLNGPALAGEGINQAHVDNLMKEQTKAEAMPQADKALVLEEVVSDALHPEEEVGPAEEEDVALTKAASAMEDAIDSLKDIARVAEDLEEDALEKLSPIERQALFN